MKFTLAVFAVVGVTLCFGSPTEVRKDWNWDELSNDVNSGIENVEQLQYENPLENDEWSLVPLASGFFRLVNVTEVEEKYKKMMEPNVDMVVTFQLHTRKNREVPQFVKENDPSSLKKSHFNPVRPTKFITHGWLNHAGSNVNVVLLKAILDNCDCNVFVVDWSEGANTMNYVSARYSVPDAATKLADFLDFLNLSGKMKFKDLTLIGHSLGAHVTGLAAKRVKRGKVHIIIGLDAASPLFSIKKPNDRLDPDDAEYVQTIHTSAGSSGFAAPLGQASFYPNWGSGQPGCGIDLLSKCSHTRSFQYYGESLYSNNSFVPFNCFSYRGIQERWCILKEKTIRMGGEPARQKYPKGVYFVPTHSESPFGMGGA